MVQKKKKSPKSRLWVKKNPRNIAALVVLQDNKELPVFELLEFTPNKKQEILFNYAYGSTQRQLDFQIRIGQLGLFPSL